MTQNRKLAYNYLLYVAMLEIRSLEFWPYPRSKWCFLSPRFWKKERHRIRYHGALADALHNLALYSSYHYEQFEEDMFWKTMDDLKTRFPDLGGHYRHRFNLILQELETGVMIPNCWIPGSTSNDN